MQKIVIILFPIIFGISLMGCGAGVEENVEETIGELHINSGSYQTTLTRIHEDCGFVPEEETGEWTVDFDNHQYHVTVETMDLYSDDGIIFSGKKISDWCTFRAIAFVNKTETGFVGFVRVSINGLCGSCYDTAGIIGEDNE